MKTSLRLGVLFAVLSLSACSSLPDWSIEVDVDVECDDGVECAPPAELDVEQPVFKDYANTQGYQCADEGWNGFVNYQVVKRQGEKVAFAKLGGAGIQDRTEGGGRGYVILPVERQFDAITLYNIDSAGNLYPGALTSASSVVFGDPEVRTYPSGDLTYRTVVVRYPSSTPGRTIVETHHIRSGFGRTCYSRDSEKVSLGGGFGSW